MDDIDLFSKQISTELRSLPSKRERLMMKQCINDAIYNFHMQSYCYAPNYMADSGASVGSSYEMYEAYNPSSITSFKPISPAIQSNIDTLSQPPICADQKSHVHAGQRENVPGAQKVVNLQSPVSISSSDSLGQVEDLLGLEGPAVKPQTETPLIPDPARPRKTHMQLRSKNVESKHKKFQFQETKMSQ